MGPGIVVGDGGVPPCYLESMHNSIDAAPCIGIDLGGTKTEVIALGAFGQELFRERVATPAADYAAIVETVGELVERADAVLAQRGTLGVGIPGALSLQTGLVKNANTTVLIGKPLDRDLSARCQRPVRIENDANCFTLSEAVDGAGAGGAVVFGVIIGTGVGGGICLNKRTWPGNNHIAGEWGHNPLPMPTAEDLPLRPCYCGRHGCIETYLSGPAATQEYARLAGTSHPLHELPQRAADGDAHAAVTLDLYTQRLARCLATIVNVLDPDVIVLGGGVSNLPGLASQTQAALPPHVFSDAVGTTIRPAFHGDASGVRGAAWLGARADRPAHTKK